jgi:hypothetical protein
LACGAVIRRAAKGRALTRFAAQHSPSSEMCARPGDMSATLTWSASNRIKGKTGPALSWGG